MLHDTNLTQHVNFPTHDPGSHTLNLVITSTDSSLNLAVTCANIQPSDHFPVFSYLKLISKSATTTSLTPSIGSIRLTILPYVMISSN